MRNLRYILKQADIFYKFTDDQLELVSHLCKERTFQAGELIFPEGSTSDELYIIAQGEVDIQINPGLVSNHPELEHELVTITRMHRGQSFGEIAMVDHGMRSASAQAAQPDTKLLRISRIELESLCEQHPRLGYRLMRNLAADLAAKLRTTDLRIRENYLYDNSKTN